MRARAGERDGRNETFWSLGWGGPAKPLAEHEVAITEPLAHGWKSAARFSSHSTSGAISADSPLERRRTTRGGATKSRCWRRAVCPFGLVPQHLPRNVFVPLDELRTCSKAGKANAIMSAGLTWIARLTKAQSHAAARPQLEDSA
jgi:hypothetical protein